MAVWTIVVAGGRGARFGALKQYELLGGRRVLDWSLAAARRSSAGVVLVVPPNSVDSSEPLADAVVGGGASRSASVRAGLAAVPADAQVDVIVVHDAARPLADDALFSRVIAAVRSGADGAITAVPVVDTVKRVAGSRVVATLAREELVVVQTPQAFRPAALRRAHAQGGEATDDAALVEAQGGVVVHVPGDAANLKITTPQDLTFLRAALGGSTERVDTPMRVGMGYDVHPFSPDESRALILGGVVFAGSPGLAGHSDADAVAHAITDALLGAAGLGDIGLHFPDTDPAWRGADSMGLLRATVGLLNGEGWMVVNVDCTVVLEAPRLAPHREAMQTALSVVIGAPVSVKAKRAEGLGAIGRREGIACHAVTLIGRI